VEWYEALRKKALVVAKFTDADKEEIRKELSEMYTKKLAELKRRSE
jgi:hypothetical protein